MLCVQSYNNSGFGNYIERSSYADNRFKIYDDCDDDFEDDKSEAFWRKSALSIDE